jgi:hypothetical protein
VGPTWPLIPHIWRALSVMVKWPEGEDDHSSSFSTMIKKTQIYISTPHMSSCSGA